MKTIKALLINPFSVMNSNKLELVDVPVDPKCNNEFDLHSCYKIIDCDLVEFVHHKLIDYMLVVDEEGLLKSEQEFFRVPRCGQEIFCGKALMFKSDENQNYIDMTEEDKTKLNIQFLTREQAWVLAKYDSNS